MEGETVTSLWVSNIMDVFVPGVEIIALCMFMTSVSQYAQGEVTCWRAAFTSGYPCPACYASSFGYSKQFPTILSWLLLSVVGKNHLSR
tara:strand:- start:805 stop:1071 length:267 start_codon:yes stop_codon:yes gene_type:complete